MRLSRADLVAPVLAIVVGGAIGGLVTLSPLVPRAPSDDVPAPDPVVAPSMTSEARADAIDRAERILRNRIDEFGVEEPLVQKVGTEANNLIITVDRNDQIYLGETPVGRIEFHESFAQIVAGGTVDNVVLKADSLATWGVGIDVVGTIQASGFPVKVVAEQRPAR